MSNLRIIILPVSCVEKESSKMLHLVERLIVGVGISDEIEQRQKNEIAGYFTNDRPHLHFFQTSITSPGDFCSMQAMGSMMRSIREWRFIRMNKLFVIIEFRMIFVDELSCFCVFVRIPNETSKDDC